LTVRTSSLCARCGRSFYKRGPMKTIETAKDRAGEEPAEKFISDLECSGSRKKRERAADIAVRFEDYSRTGRLRTRDLNDLEDGIRELKAGAVRLPFYDAVVNGHTNLIRLTHGFMKNGEKCPRKEIRKALAIRETDRAQ
jgi:phage-related protein